MGEKTPDTDESGIERRDILKGLGFGAMGLAGVGAMSGNVAAAATPLNVGITPPDEDLEDDEESPGGVPTLKPDTHKTYDLVAYVGMNNKKSMLGQHFTLLTRSSPPKAVTQSFEEGTAEASTSEEKADSSGTSEIRKRFSVENLDSGSYMAVLSLMDYTSIAPDSVAPVATSGDGIPVDACTVIAQAFDI